MSLFYFDINDGLEAAYDDTGTELADRAEARKEALAVLAPVAREGLPDSMKCAVTVTVRDGAKRPLFHASLTLVEDWIE